MLREQSRPTGTTQVSRKRQRSHNREPRGTNSQARPEVLHISRLSARSPSIQITVGGLRIEARVDSGVEITIVADSVFDKWKNKPRKVRDVVLYMADQDSALQGFMTAPVPIMIGGAHFQESVYVAPIFDDMLLGQDLMHLWGVTLDWRRDELLIGVEKVPLKTKFRSTHNRAVSPPAKPGRRSLKECWVPHCHAVTLKLKDHAFNVHLPGILDEQLDPAADEVLDLRTRALSQAATFLLGQPGTLPELAEHVANQGLLMDSDNACIRESQRAAMDALSCHLGEPVPEQYRLSPLSATAALIHWKVALLMVSRMTKEQQDYWRQQYPKPGTLPQEANRESSRPRAFDIHFHLDRTLKAMRLRPGAGLQSILDGTQVTPGKEVWLVGSCASFSDPASYPTMLELHKFPVDMEVAVGLHPKHCSQHWQQPVWGAEGQALPRLKELSRSPRVIAFGEVGLDHSLPMETWWSQARVLEKVLKMVEPRHVLVLHCKGSPKDDGTEVYALLRYLVERQIPREQRMCLHNFTGDYYAQDRWLACFPNVYYGVTSQAGSFRPSQVEALRGIPADRLLLETDAPYFAAPGDRWSAPNQLYHVAQAVAPHLDTTPEVLLEVTTSNALQLFQL